MGREKKDTDNKRIRTIWAVVCGAIRDELEVRLVLDELLRMRSEGTIQGIVISTWRGDFDKYPKLHQEIVENDIHILEQAPLNDRIDIGRTNSVNYLRQAVQMQKALDCLPEGCFVVKARTDRSLNHLKQIESYLKKHPQKISNRKDLKKYKGILPSIFEYPLTIFNAKVHRILHFSDFVFYGYIDDVRKLMNFDIAELYLDRDLVANTQWFVYPFLENIPVIRDYFRLINFRPLIQDMREVLEEDSNPEVIPHFFYRVYACYLMILDNYFELVDFTGEISEETEYHFFDLFIDAKDKGISFTMLGSALLGDNVIDAFLNRECVGNTVSDRQFKKVIDDLQITQKATAKEYEEMFKFREHGWFKRKGWLRTPNFRPVVEKQISKEKRTLLDFHFKGLSEKESRILMEELKFAGSTDRYLYHYWLDHEKLSSDSAEQMILPFARTQNQDGVMLMSRLLRLEKLSSKECVNNVKRLITVTSNVQLKRQTANIKTYQMLLNMYLFDQSKESFEKIYDDPDGRRIVQHYLKDFEQQEVLEKRLNRQELAEYMFERSDYYKEIGRTVISLRMEEFASELLLNKHSIERIQRRYERDNNRRNNVLAKRTLSFFH